MSCKEIVIRVTMPDTKFSTVSLLALHSPGHLFVSTVSLLSRQFLICLSTRRRSPPREKETYRKREKDCLTGRQIASHNIQINREIHLGSHCTGRLSLIW